MNRRNLLLAAAALALAPLAAWAHDTTIGNLTIEHAWSRATGQTRPGVGYMVIHNKGAEADRLVAAESPIAGRVELHAHIMENDVAKMVQVEAIDVPAGGMAELKPHGFHLMMMELKQPLAEGDTFPVTLVFERAGRVDVTFVTQAAGSSGPDAHN